MISLSKIMIAAVGIGIDELCGFFAGGRVVPGGNGAAAAAVCSSLCCRCLGCLSRRLLQGVENVLDVVTAAAAAVVEQELITRRGRRMTLK